MRNIPIAIEIFLIDKVMILKFITIFKYKFKLYEKVQYFLQT